MSLPWTNHDLYLVSLQTLSHHSKLIGPVIFKSVKYRSWTQISFKLDTCKDGYFKLYVRMTSFAAQHFINWFEFPEVCCTAQSSLFWKWAFIEFLMATACITLFPFSKSHVIPVLIPQFTASDHYKQRCKCGSFVSLAPLTSDTRTLCRHWLVFFHRQIQHFILSFRSLRSILSVSKALGAPDDQVSAPSKFMPTNAAKGHRITYVTGIGKLISVFHALKTNICPLNLTTNLTQIREHSSSTSGDEIPTPFHLKRVVARCIPTLPTSAGRVLFECTPNADNSIFPSRSQASWCSLRTHAIIPGRSI